MMREPFDIDAAETAYEALKMPGEKPLLVLLKYPERIEARGATLKLQAPQLIAGRIRVALVGAGGFAQGMHLPNLQKLRDLYELRTVVSRTGLSARTAAERFGAATATTDYASVLADPEIDLMLIATRHDLHAGMVMQALRAGKNVFVEKPLSLNDEELAEIEAFFAETDKTPLLMTGFNRRFAPAITVAKQIIANRASPMIVNYRMNAGYIPKDHWVHGPQGGGRNIGEACHIYDLFNALTGSLPTEVSATSISPASDYWRRDDNFVATVRYEDGSVCTLTYTAMGARDYPKERAEIFVDGKVLTLDDYQSLTVVGGAGGWKANVIEKGQLEELRALAEAFKVGGKWPISMEEQRAADSRKF